MSCGVRDVTLLAETFVYCHTGVMKLSVAHHFRVMVLLGGQTSVVRGNCMQKWMLIM